VSCSAELRQEGEGLALRLIGTEPAGNRAASPWTSNLAKLSNSAAREGAGQLAQAATALMRALQTRVGDPAAGLQQGIVRQAAAPSSAEPAPPLSQHTELLGDFVLESREHLAAIEAQLLTLERDPSNRKTLHSILRGFHTIKDQAGFLELREVQILAHETEALLDRARDSEWTLDATAIDAILDSADHLRRWLSHTDAELRHRPSQAPPANEPLLVRLHALKQVPAPPEPPTVDLAHLASAVVAKLPAGLRPHLASGATAQDPVPRTTGVTGRGGRGLVRAVRERCYDENDQSSEIGGVPSWATRRSSMSLACSSSFPSMPSIITRVVGSLSPK